MTKEIYEEESSLTKDEAALIDRNEISSNSLTEDEELYKENIVDHYKHPHNTGKLTDCTFMHRELNPLCGDDITVYAKIKNNKITEFTFVGKGCAISQASISMLTDHVKEMTLEEAKIVTRDDLLKLLGIPIGVVRMKCALLSLKTLLKGIQKFEYGGM